MTHRRALLVALAFAVLFAGGLLAAGAPGRAGWGSVEIVDISTGESRRGGHRNIDYHPAVPGRRFGVFYRFMAS